MTTDDLSKKTIEYLIKQAEEFQEENKHLLEILQDISPKAMHLFNTVIEQERVIYLLTKEAEQIKRENNKLKEEIEEYKAKYNQLETIAVVWKEQFLRIIDSLGKI